jgi:hypothetical protein
MSTKVEFQGTQYWLMNEPDTDFGALAPLEHCDDSGELLLKHCFSVSFAHLWPDGHISRFGRMIGTREDLKVLQS